METRLSRYLLLILLMLIIGLVVEEYGNDGIRMTTKDKVIEHFLSNRYKAGAICRDKGWQFCQNWAELPRSRFNLGSQPDSISNKWSNKQPNKGLSKGPKQESTSQPQNPELSASQNRTEQHQYQFNDPDSPLFTHIPGCATSTMTEAEQTQRKQNRKRIYSWTDENGQTHFTDDDRVYAQHNIALTQYQEPEYSFELEVNSTGGKLPLFYKDKVTAAIKKVSDIYKSYLPESGVAPVKVNLTLAKSKSSYNRLQAKYAPKLGPSQGFYVARQNMAVVHHKNDKQAHQTSVHEAVHVLNAGLFGPTPRWFNEGMAEYFESIEMSGFVAKIPARDWKRTLAGKKLSVNALLSAKRQTWAGSQQTSLYAQSHSLIHFLMSSKQGKQTITKLLAHMVQTRCEASDPKSVLSRYPSGLNKLHTDWIAWINSRKYRTHTF
ncbi:DUF1570 domain-containing protein [Shewanella eurypsychrophilus]|uniref:DUF1570 domain-containing protein n=1 Tax=Shewanella eurypsychrophilus TaxID=2593656 RepID=A0ABX6V8E4_9GAMM|nr:MULTISPECIES: DUF1570 domain-containing protein [Shewanella]QFU22852.1 DUF1570 domain-containing protein [Shewanella sp. YLB-09]QPG58139.1 DUF1570 domain-containing protein [Shewanella eurypsychrophilus]